jgi:hypothetical protein
VDRFNITTETCTIGFQEHILINLLRPIPDQLQRRYLYNRSGPDKGNPEKLKKIIERNSSLRIDFGWSFESSTHYEQIMKECIEEVIPKFNVGVSRMVSDLRCSWLGFIPLNTFEKIVYEDLSLYGLIIFNNDLVNFQTEVIKFITEHQSYRQHALLRNERYRFQYFKDIRKDPDALEAAYQHYMNAVTDVCMISSLPRDIVELEIGCHFLYHPDLFFELLEFSILKGTIHE